MRLRNKFWNIFQVVMVFVLFLDNSCKESDYKPIDEDPFKVIAITPLTDNIPNLKLGSGKILFERINDPGGSGFYVIDINSKTSYGFRLNSLTAEPSISPDGTKIACSLLNSSSWTSMWNIYLMNIDGSNCFPVYQSNSKESYPTWTSDGLKVIFYLSNKNEGPLYMQSPTENASDRVELIKFLYGDDPDWFILPSGGFSISPEGKLVCVSNSTSFFGILGISPYVGKSGVSTLLPNTDINQSFESPVFSPDGNKIAFLSIQRDNAGLKAVSVKIINQDGANLTELASVSAYKSPAPYSNLHRYVSLCWSPDGTKILFTVPTEEYGCHLFLINADGSGLTQVTDNRKAYDYNITWGR